MIWNVIINKNKLAKWFLRIGLAFVFVYASVEVCIHPSNFLKYVPHCVMSVVPLHLFLPIFGAVEVLLAVWLLSGWKVQYPSLISVLMMVGIIVCNPEHFQILFRNVAIGFGGLALIMLELQHDNAQRA